MSEQKLPTCLVALRAEIGNTLVEMEHRVAQVEQAYSSLGWEADQLRESNKALLDRIALEESDNAQLKHRLKEMSQEHYVELPRKLAATELDLKRIQGLYEELLHIQPTLVTPQQACDQINKVHDELMEKLSAERKQLETARLELDRNAEELENVYSLNGKHIINEARLKKHVQAQRVQIDAAASGLDVLSNMVKELQSKLDESEAKRMATEDDYGKLVGEHEDYVRKYEQLRDLIMDPNLQRNDRYLAFAQALNVGRHEAKMAVHRFVAQHPVCKDLKTQVDVLCHRLEEGKLRVTKAEVLHEYRGEAMKVLECVINLTSKDIRALQYGPHHGHQRLYKVITHFLRKFNTEQVCDNDNQR